MTAHPIPPFSGRCLCGAIRYDCNAAPDWQRAMQADAGMSQVFAMADGHWLWSWREPTLFALTTGERRLFCPTCGTQMAFRHPGHPGLMLFHAATLTDPAAESPEAGLPTADLLPWVPPADHDLIP